MSFSPFDEDSRSFCDYMTKKLGTQPGVEVFVSGLGISNMYEWWKATKGIPSNPLFQKIEETEPSDRPKYISRASDTDPVAAEMMRLFVKMLGRFASDVSALLLPLGGLYLAGGTVQKDMRWLERDHLFMKYFEKNYNPNIRPLLQKMPVYIIKDYSISLYGAANASLNLQQAK
jgi:glucokinase